MIYQIIKSSESDVNSSLDKNDLSLLKKSTNFFKSISEKIKNFFSKPPKLIFKKYYYLNEKYEKKDYKTDPVRLELIIMQVFKDILHNYFKFKLNDYIFYFGIYAYIFYYPYYDNDKKLEVTYLKAIYDLIPKIFYEMLKQNDNFKNLCLENWKKVTEGKISKN